MIMRNWRISKTRKAQSFPPSALSNTFMFPEPTFPIPQSDEQETPAKRPWAWKVAPNLLVSFRYAWAGVSYAFTTQRNFRIHTLIATLAISLGFCLHISAVEMSVVALTCALVMVLELLNTAIESVVDLTVKQTYHELAKIAKDCAAGAVLISAIASVLVAGFILLPHALDLIISI